MKYVIKLSEAGYFGYIPYTPMPREKADVFDSMKDARRQLNRLNGRLMKKGNAQIEPL